MCRTRKEIIETDTTLQDLSISIKLYEEELAKGENGHTHFELAQARASLDTRISQIQGEENMMEKFVEASDKREEMHTELSGKLGICETNLKKVEGALKTHLDDHKAFPPLKKAIALAPFKTLGWLGTIILATYTFLFFLSHILLYSTGFDVMLETWITNLFGI